MRSTQVRDCKSPSAPSGVFSFAQYATLTLLIFFSSCAQGEAVLIDVADVSRK